MYGAERAQQIEKHAKGIVAWYNEFVCAVHDSRGLSIKGDLDEFMAELEAVLDPPAPKPVPPPVRGCAPKPCTFIAGGERCTICGWAW
tara:strand:- start:15 stop:278 length:264 start_codon:yes stop_codon:yes gene_type:complete